MASRNMNDPVAVYAELRETYSRERGQQRGTGTIPSSQMFPKTSYFDVMTIGMMFYDWIDKGFDDSGSLLLSVSLPSPLVDLATEERTANYRRWREALRQSLPDKAAFDALAASGMGATAALATVASRIIAPAPGYTYEFNEAFWSLMEKAAIARFASGQVPSAWVMAKGAAWEATKALPGAIAGAIGAVLPDVDWPDFQFDLTKWMLIGAGGFGLYWLWKKRQAG